MGTKSIVTSFFRAEYGWCSKVRLYKFQATLVRRDLCEISMRYIPS